MNDKHLICFLLLLFVSNSSAAMFGLSGPDGQAIKLGRVHMRIACHGPLTLTEIELHFKNPQAKTIEGKFTCTLPPGATLSRFAKELNGELMEGEVVERQRAKRVYRSILHTMRDPALLEQDSANVFKAKIFPIAPHDSVRLILSYSQVLTVDENGVRTMNIPLRGMPEMQHFVLTALFKPLAGEEISTIRVDDRDRQLSKDKEGIFRDKLLRKNFAPQKDISYQMKSPVKRETLLVSGGDYRMVCLRPPVPKPANRFSQEAWVFYVDTSASQSLHAQARLKAINSLVASLAHKDPESPLRLMVFDNEVKEVGQWPRLAQALKEPRDLIAEHTFMGATNLSLTLDKLLADGQSTKVPSTFVLLTDGNATLGTKEHSLLVQKIKKWPTRHKLHVLVIGGEENKETTSALARAGSGRVINIPLTDDWWNRVEDATDTLRRPMGCKLTITAAGVEWLEPRVFTDVLPGNEVFAFAKIKKGRTIDLRASWPGSRLKAVTVKNVDIKDFAPLLEREAIKAYLAALEEKRQKASDSARGVIKSHMINLSTHFRVLCPFTAMLVLESEGDYYRYGIDRRALADILFVRGDGIAVKGRRPKSDESPQMMVKRPLFPPKDGPRIRSISFDPSDTEVRISWATDIETDTKVYIGRSSLYTRQATNREQTKETDHSITISGLEPDTIYHYAIVAHYGKNKTPVFSGDKSFRTLPRGASRSMFQDHSTAIPPRIGPEEPAPTNRIRAGGRLQMKQFFDKRNRMSRLERLRLQTHFARFIRRTKRMTSGEKAMAVASVTSERNFVIRRQFLQSWQQELEKKGIKTGMDKKEVGIIDNLYYVNKRKAFARLDASLKQLFSVDPANMDFLFKRYRGKPVPEWVRLRYGTTEKDLLHGKNLVKNNPRDRRARIAYCWALHNLEQYDELLKAAAEWQEYDETNPLVYEYLGHAYAGLGDKYSALRAYSSLGEVAPSISGLLDRAAYLLMSEGHYVEAEEFLGNAIRFEPDNHNHYRGLALVQWLRGNYIASLATYEKVLTMTIHNRYGKAKDLIKEEMATMLRAWLSTGKVTKRRIDGLFKKWKVSSKKDAPLRVTVHWETEATNVDLHVTSPRGDECSAKKGSNPSGLRLLDDCRRGLGPESIYVEPRRLLKGSYHVGVKYPSSGPMGLSRGIVLIQKPSEKGKAVISIVPFCLLPRTKKSVRYLGEVRIN